MNAVKKLPLPRQRGIKSYVLREGHLTGKQARAVRDFYPQWGLTYQPQLLNWQEVFGNDRPVILEIGFGMGDTTAATAAAYPERNFLGVEVYTPGVGHLLGLINERGLTNLRLIQYDAVAVLTSMIGDLALAGVHIYFPDPWPKTRHHKRRLIQAPFIALLAAKLTGQGYIHLATDWEDYARQMLAVLTAAPQLHNMYPDFAPTAGLRPGTKFETRGRNLGLKVRDLVFAKNK